MTDNPAQESTVPADEATAQDFNVGIRLRRLRLERGLSQRELARRAGMTNANLSMIEQGRVSPSVMTLGKILNAIPLSFAEFFDANRESAPVIFPRATQAHVRYQGCDCYMVTPQVFGMPILARLVVPPGGAVECDVLSLPSCWISGMVQAGELTLIIGESRHPVRGGDAFRFHSRRSCVFSNSAHIEAALILVGTHDEPELGKKV